MDGSGHQGSAGGGRGGYRRLARELAEGRHGPWLDARLEHVDARRDLADHQLLGVLALYLKAGDLLAPAQRERIERSMLDFKYCWDEPGVDDMCTWSETHQLLFAVEEHLAGLRLAGRVFANDGRTGQDKSRRAAVRLREWLDNRFHHGFSEWLSSTYYELDVVGLSLLIDHAEDADLVTRATMVLDLVFLDLAMHRFDGYLVATSGRAYAKQKAHPSRAEVVAVMREAFEGPQPFHHDRLAAPFIDRDRYEVPRVLVQIATAPGEHRMLASHGLDVPEASAEVAWRTGLDADQRHRALVRLLWGMEAFATLEGIVPSMDEIRRTSLLRNRYLAALARFARVRSPRLLTALVRTLNPVQQGAALQRADVMTYRTPHYLLSSVQHHQPGRFGDQQHLWVAGLPGDITVFSTHPGATLLADDVRPATPSEWVGNGVNPDIAQADNVLLASYDTTPRAGWLEGYRHEFSHLFFPFSRFDETHLGSRCVAGRRGDSFIGVVAVHPLELVTEMELVQRGDHTGWAVVVADRSQFGSLAHLVAKLQRSRLTQRAGVLSWTTAEHTYRLDHGRGFQVDGRDVTSRYPRYDTPWVHAVRRPDAMVVTGERERLVLDWANGVREVLPCEDALSA